MAGKLLPSDLDAAYEAVVRDSVKGTVILAEWLWPGKQFNTALIEHEMRARTMDKKESIVDGARMGTVPFGEDADALKAWFERQSKESQDFMREDCRMHML